MFNWVLLIGLHNGKLQQCHMYDYRWIYILLSLDKNAVVDEHVFNRGLLIVLHNCVIMITSGKYSFVNQMITG